MIFKKSFDFSISDKNFITNFASVEYKRPISSSRYLGWFTSRILVFPNWDHYPIHFDLTQTIYFLYGFLQGSTRLEVLLD